MNDDTLAFDAMARVVNGDGHFMGEPGTLAAMERDYCYPRLGDRLEPTAWAEAGAADAWQRAGAAARDILERHRPRYIDPAVDTKLRARFDILI